MTQQNSVGTHDLIDLAPSLEWHSDQGHHRETRHFSNYNVWRDLDLVPLLPKLKTPVFVGGKVDVHDAESSAFQGAGGILLGSSLTVAPRVFERHVPAYPSAGDNR